MLAKKLSCRSSSARRLTELPARLRSSSRMRSAHADARKLSDLLASPTWSVRALGPASPKDGATKADIVTPAQLRHLLRLSALPLPSSAAEEAAMLKTLQSQLHFVRSVQHVDTAGVEPLQSIRDETSQVNTAAVIGVAQMGEALANEIVFGHYNRPRKKLSQPGPDDKNHWDVLESASRTAGRYFVVNSPKPGAE